MEAQSRTRPPIAYFMIGLTGSGKTTLAKKIEAERGALRFTPDEWMAALEIDLFDEAARERIEALIWKTAERALRLGTDVVIDFGLWSKAERTDYRARAEAAGAKPEFHVLIVGKEELLRRLKLRGQDPSEAVISEEQLDSYIRRFEPPDPDEFDEPC